jgi:hypothetical protein
MESLNDSMARRWKNHKRGLTTDSEFAATFFFEIGYSGADAVDAFRGLPDDQQKPIADYVLGIAIEDIKFHVIGEASDEHIRAQTAIWQSNAIAIAKHLSS